MTQDPTPAPVREADDVAERFVVDLAAADPIMATYAGIAGHEDRLPDLTPDGLRRARGAAAPGPRRDAAQRPRPTTASEVAQSSFLERADTSLALSEAHQPQSRINVIDSAAHEHPRRLRPDGDARPRTTGPPSRPGWPRCPQALADYRATLLQEADHGHVSPRRQMVEAAGQIHAWTGRAGSAGDVFAQQVAQATDVPATLESDLAKHAVEASAAFAEFATFLERRAGPTRTRQGGGRPRAVRPRLALLPRQRDRPRRDLRLGLGGAAPHRDRDARDLGDAGRRRRHDRRRRGRPRRRPAPQRIDVRTPSASGCRSSPTAPSPTWPTPTSTSPSRSAGSSAGSRRPTTAASTTRRRRGLHPAGADVVVDPRRRRRRSTPGARSTTVFHEGVPGHHLQCAQTAYRTDLLNRWQRSMCWVSGHGEGWALYAERLMDELGYLVRPGRQARLARRAGDPRDPRDRRHRHAPRAGDPARQPVRLPPRRALDRRAGAGVHAPARPDGRRHDRLRDQPLPRLPAQAPSYKVGERIWLQARDEEQGRARAPPSTSRRSTARPSTSARSASTRCGRRWRGSDRGLEGMPRP